MPLTLDAQPRGNEPGEITTFTRIVNLLGILLPFFGMVAAIVLLWGPGFNLIYASLLLVMYLLSGIGITVGYHRLFCHRAFEAGWGVRATLAVLGSIALQGPVLRWVATHRSHHHHSDQEEDPHSPHHQGDGIIGTLKGLWHAHMGWMLCDGPPDYERYVPDLLADPLMRAMSRLWPVWALLGVLVPAAIGGLVTMSWIGVFLGGLWGGLVRIFLGHHITFSINSVCHMWGSQPFRTHDHSRNNVIFGLLGLGEGWHNNHHAFPSSARHGLRWWQIDFGWAIIRLLAAVRLAWNVKVPDAERQHEKLHAQPEPM